MLLFFCPFFVGLVLRRILVLFVLYLCLHFFLFLLFIPTQHRNLHFFFLDEFSFNSLRPQESWSWTYGRGVNNIIHLFFIFVSILLSLEWSKTFRLPFRNKSRWRKLININLRLEVGSLEKIITISQREVWVVRSYFRVHLSFKSLKRKYGVLQMSIGKHFSILEF